MDKKNALGELGNLLQQGVQIVVRPERLAPSTIYDLQYRLAVVACAFVRHAKVDIVDNRRIQAARLKLFQFVACRPRLLPVVQEWSKHRTDAQLSMLSSQGLRRGFLSDQMHDDVIGFLIARNALIHANQYLASGPDFQALLDIQESAVSQELFVPEREVLEQLAAITVTNQMLEGW